VITEIENTVLGSEENDPAFHTSMIHLYRGEMNRLTVWRRRLDVTSNWAILLTMGLTTFTLGDANVPHYVLLLGLALVGISVAIEGRRYRHLYQSKWRVWLLEDGYFAPLLDPGYNPPPGWRRRLAADLANPDFLIPWFCAIRVRLRRNYLFLLYLITGVWLVKLFIHPATPESPSELFQRLAVGGLFHPWFVAVTSVVFVGGATFLALSCPPAEELERWLPEKAQKS